MTQPAGGSTSPVTISIDIWSDIACPWCYIGKRKLEAGLESFAADRDTEVDITYHSFELAPDTPVDFEGSEVDFLAGHKGMPTDQVEQMLARVTQIAESVGLHYDFDSLKHTKTLTAHEALHHAKEHGRQLELMEALFAAYFEQGRHVGRVDDLVEIGASVGLDPDELRAALASGEHADAVRQDLAQAQQYGISGVPFFVFNNKYGVSGAQESDTFAQVLTQVDDELRAGAAR